MQRKFRNQSGSCQKYSYQLRHQTTGVWRPTNSLLEHKKTGYVNADSQYSFLFSQSFDLIGDIGVGVGINTLISIMSKFGNSYEKQSSIMHNERLEFLGDAVIEFITSIHLYHLFPEIEEGGLATYRAAIVQNQHLTLMALVRQVAGHFFVFVFS